MSASIRDNTSLLSTSSLGRDSLKSVGVALGRSWDVRWASSWARAVLILGNADVGAEEGAVSDVGGDNEGGSRNWVGIVRREVSTSRNRPEPFVPFVPFVPFAAPPPDIDSCEDPGDTRSAN